MSDHNPVTNPAHYTSYKGIEVIQLTEQLNFNRGNVVKYTARAGLKGDTLDAEIQDLEKARWYLEREIARIRALRSEGCLICANFNPLHTDEHYYADQASDSEATEDDTQES